MVSICSQIEQPFSCIFLAPAQLHQWTVEIWLQPPHIRGVKTVCAGSPLKSKFSCKRRPHKSTTCSVLLDSWVNKTNTFVFHYLFHRKKSKRPSSNFWKDASDSASSDHFQHKPPGFISMNATKVFPFLIDLKMVTPIPFKKCPIIFSKKNHCNCNHTSDFSSKLYNTE